MMHELNRRRFIQTTIAGSAALTVNPLFAAPQAFKANDKVQLGKTGITVSRLAMGTGMRGRGDSSDQTRLGQEKFTELIRTGFDKGLFFFDMADFYGSHPFVKNALEGVPRDRYVLLSKVWQMGSRGKFSGSAKTDVERFLKELNTEMIDIVLLHCVTSEKWPGELNKMRDELSGLKEKGTIRAVGVSCHSHPSLLAAAKHPWVDVIFARINHNGNKMDDTPDEISKTLKLARENGKAIVGMKIFGEGTLVKPEEKDASFNYVLKNNLVDAMTVGMTAPDHVTDCFDRIEKVA